MSLTTTSRFLPSNFPNAIVDTKWPEKSTKRQGLKVPSPARFRVETTVLVPDDQIRNAVTVEVTGSNRQRIRGWVRNDLRRGELHTV
jgi:hypothetical protein